MTTEPFPVDAVETAIRYADQAAKSVDAAVSGPGPNTPETKKALIDLGKAVYFLGRVLAEGRGK
jgi:hypothetical protein